MTYNQRTNALYVLSTCLLLTIIMVAVGGITRLTHAGLSIVEWEPIMGIIPPLTETAWQGVFAKYQSMPEYQHLYPDMHIDAFKSIFWMEYSHRLLGRIIGLLVLLPLLYGVFAKNLTKTTLKQLCFLGILVLLQGMLGWWMVKSGLKDDPFVSPLRLAMHLSLALFIISLLVWFLGGYIKDPLCSDFSLSQKEGAFLHKASMVLFGLIAVQIIIGALVAGLKGGLVYNSFPKMGKEWIPEDAFSLTPFYYNFFHNPVCAQLLHRLGGCLILIYSLYWGYLIVKVQNKKLRHMGILVGWLLLLQITLGIVTLIYNVPLIFGVLHQMGGVVLVIAMTRLCYLLSCEATGKTSIPVH